MIGIVDWGIGGLGLYARLRERRPAWPILYFSDAGYTPYGKLPVAQLAARVRHIAGFMRAAGVSHVVLACNAASTVLPRLGVPESAGVLDTAHGAVHVTGVIAHGVRMVLDLDEEHGHLQSVGVIGGRRTVRSHAYRRALQAGGRHVVQRIAQPLSARVEAGDLDSVELQGELLAIVAPLRAIDVLVLGCTHYPALAPSIQRVLPNTRLVDPCEGLQRWIEDNWQLDGTSGTSTFITTGDVNGMRNAAQRAFGVQLGHVIAHSDSAR